MDRNSSSLKIVVLLSGRGSNYEAIQNAINDGKVTAEVAAVVSDKPKAAGLDIARNSSVPTEVVRRQAKTLSTAEYNTLLADTVERYSPDLVVLAGFMRILTAEFVSRFPHRVINIHPSLLPSFRGLHAHQQALEAGVCFSGCTIHYVVEEVDAGPIIAQAVVPVLREDSEDELAARVLKCEHQLYPAVIQAISQSDISVVDGKVEWKAAPAGAGSEDFLLSLG